MSNKKKNKSGSRENMTSGNIASRLSLACIFLYLCTEFIPAGGTGEVLGSQWFYLSIINIISLLSFITFFKPGSFSGLTRVYVPYVLFTALAGLSILYATNRTEAADNFSRQLCTFIAVSCFYFHLVRSAVSFLLLSAVISVLAAIQGIQTLSSFFSQTGDTDINTIILGLTGNAGNKNILSASLVMKIPFLIYCIYTSNSYKKFFFSFTLALTGAAVFILNARAAYLGLLLAVLFYTIGILYTNNWKIRAPRVLNVISLIWIPLISGLLFSQFTIRKTISNQGISTTYGSVFERLNTISFSAEGSSNRAQMWSSALDYISKNPLTGCGTGNWKLKSIPYEKTYVDELRIAKHTHNDFLEMTAELGIPGGLLYLLMFIMAAFTLLHAIRKRSDHKDISVPITLFALLLTYSTDAFFNFPAERPATQVFFILLFGFTLYLGRNFNLTSSTETVQQPKSGMQKLYTWLLLLMMIPCTYITFSHFKSLIAQAKVNDDIQQTTPSTTWEEIRDAFPAIPNMNNYGFPISHIKAFYLLKEQKYDSALLLINSHLDVNPDLTLSEYLKAKIFRETNRNDSAYYYARKAFYNKPRARSHYELLNTILSERADSSGIDSAFQEFSRYRNEAWAWNRYIELKSGAGTDPAGIQRILNQALRYFPADAGLLQKAEFISRTVSPGGKKIQDFQLVFAKGVESFTKKQYREAIRYFTEASSLNPSDYLAVENTGLCYYSMSDYKKAIPYFQQVLRNFSVSDGKSEFLLAISLLNLGNATDACPYLRQSVAKGFPQAAEQKAKYCP